jgi:hypothetical protein
MYHVDIGHLYDLDDRLCYLLMEAEPTDGMRRPLIPLPSSKVDVGELTKKFNINTIITELRSRGYEAHADTGKHLNRTVTWCIRVVSKECSFDVVIDYSELNIIFIVKADLRGFHLETSTRDSPTLGDSCIEMSYTMKTFSKLDTFYKYFLENNGTKTEESRCIQNRIPCDQPIPTLHSPIKQFAAAVRGHLWKYNKFHNNNKPADFCYGEHSLYPNNLKLDGLSNCVFDFLAYFGYQDKIYMKLNPVHRHLVGCLVRFHAIDIRKKKLRSHWGRVFEVGPFDLTYYLDLIKPPAANGLPNEPCVKLSIDRRLCSQIDGMISVASSLESTSIRTQKVSEAVKQISLHHVLSKLPGFSGRGISRTHDLLLNYSMVFVFSKLIGQSYDEAIEGIDGKEIALSFIIRNLLTESSIYIEEFVKYFERESMRGSIWTLFTD